MKEINIKNIFEVPGDFTGIANFENGSLGRFESGTLHCLNGPAIKTHRGIEEWYRYGLFHRLDGPAIEYPSGVSLWFINGANLSKQEFIRRTKLIQQQLSKRQTNHKYLTDEQWHGYLNILVVE